MVFQIPLRALFPLQERAYLERDRVERREIKRDQIFCKILFENDVCVFFQRRGKKPDPKIPKILNNKNSFSQYKDFFFFFFLSFIFFFFFLFFFFLFFFFFNFSSVSLKMNDLRQAPSLRDKTRRFILNF